jgi:small-conductance mechanosensitive channel
MRLRGQRITAGGVPQDSPAMRMSRLRGACDCANPTRRRAYRPAEEVRLMILDLPQWTSLLLVLIAVPALALAALDLVHALLDRLMQARGAPVLKRVLRDGRVAVRVTVALFDAYIDLSRSGGENYLLMRRRRTQLVVFRRFAVSAGLLLTLGLVLTAIPPVRAIGLSLFASAGVAGIVAGIAARPAVSNLIAGLQLAVTQPIRIGDAVLVEGAWGHVEEIGSTFVTVTTWDQRSLIVPLTYFLEKPIRNWTRNSTRLLDTVFIYLDYGVPVEALRAKAKEILKSTPLWDCRVFAV